MPEHHADETKPCATCMSGAGNRVIIVGHAWHSVHSSTQAVATCCRWVNDKSPATMVMGFDQEAAAVLTARLASWKMETEEDFDATR